MISAPFAFGEDALAAFAIAGWTDLEKSVHGLPATCEALQARRPYPTETPLMWLSKAQSLGADRQPGRRGADVAGGAPHPHGCYLGVRGQRHAWGHGCGQCPPIRLRPIEDCDAGEFAAGLGRPDSVPPAVRFPGKICWAGGAAVTLPDGTMGWLLFLGVLGLWLLGAHNRITALKAAVLAAWQQVDAHIVASDCPGGAWRRGGGAALQSAAEPLASETAALEDRGPRPRPAGAGRGRPGALWREGAVATAADAVADLAKAAMRCWPRCWCACWRLRRRSSARCRPTPPSPAETLQALRRRAGAAGLRAASPPSTGHLDAGAAYNAATLQFPTRLLGSLLRFGRAGRL